MVSTFPLPQNGVCRTPSSLPIAAALVRELRIEGRRSYHGERLVAIQSHKLDLVGSIPTPATTGENRQGLKVLDPPSPRLVVSNEVPALHFEDIGDGHPV